MRNIGKQACQKLRKFAINAKNRADITKLFEDNNTDAKYIENAISSG